MAEITYALTDGVYAQSGGHYVDSVGAAAESPFLFSTTDEGDSSLELYYPCEETSGTTANDESTNSNDGTYETPTLGATGVGGTNAPDYDGTDDRLTFPNLGIFNQATDWTVVLFVNFDTLGGDNNLWHPRGEHDYSLYVGGGVGASASTDEVSLVVYDGSNNILDTDYIMSTGEFVLVSARLDSSNDSYTVWVRSENDASATTATGVLPDPNATNDTNVIGAQESGSLDRHHCNGRIDEIRMYSRELTNAQIQSLWDTAFA